MPDRLSLPQGLPIYSLPSHVTFSQVSAITRRIWFAREDFAVASITKRPNDMWRARYRDAEGKEHARHFARKLDAKRWLDGVTAAVVSGTYVDPRDHTTVTEYARRWAASRPHGERTARRTESSIRCHIEATTLGTRRLATVLPSEVQGWVSDRATVLAPTTLRALVKLLRSIFAAAVLDRLISSSPAVRLSLPPMHRERVVPLTVDQVRALADAMAPEHRAMVLTQAGLGLRIGELLALRTSDVDFLRRTARVEHQIAQRTRERVPPKTPHSRRTIPLPDMVAVALAEHLRLHPAAPDGLIFHLSNGRPHWHEHYGTRVFMRAVAQGGLPGGTTSHDLRHHYASVLLAAGESVIAVAERLGHEDATLVLTTYGHLMPDTEDRTRRAVDSAWTDRAADFSRTGE